MRARPVCLKGSAGAGLRRRWFEQRLLPAVFATMLAAVLPYVQTLGFGFIYDDYWTVAGNRHLDKPFFELMRGLASGRALGWNMPDATRPLMSASLWLDRRLFGLSPWGHHLDSVALYVMVSISVAALSFALLRRWYAALVAGVVFAVSPLHAEVVAAVNYREDLLAALGLVAGLALLYWPSPRFARSRVYAVGAAWACALLAKESACIGPLLFGAVALVRPPPRALVRQAPRLVATAACVGVAWLAWRLWLSHLGEQIPRAAHGSLAQIVLRTLRYETWAIGSSLVPLLARPERAPPPAASALWLLPLLALPLAALCFARFSSLRAPLGAVAIAAVAPLATSPLAAPINEMADRYCFVGSFGGALLAGWLALRVSRMNTPLSALAVAGVALSGVVASLGAASVWASEVALWTFAAETAPRSGRAWASLSRVHRLAGQHELAERAAQRALEERPGYASAQIARVLNDLAAGRVSLGRERLAELVAQNTLQRDNLRVAERCASRQDEGAVALCVRDAVPSGMVLGDVEVLRRTSSRLLARRD